ncbi:hypothetical protein [Streptomyces shenzhenensis]|uniref:hypothetical protein n=1 Tax=Streptomyces shenzhenensis TaxID=943815 RepID=UPI0036CC3ED3
MTGGSRGIGREVVTRLAADGLAVVVGSAGQAAASKPAVVLAHGAFADASGWNSVAKNLRDDGCTVVAPANPLRGLPQDAAYVAGVPAQEARSAAPGKRGMSAPVSARITCAARTSTPGIVTRSSMRRCMW